MSSLCCKSWGWLLHLSVVLVLLGFGFSDQDIDGFDDNDINSINKVESLSSSTETIIIKESTTVDNVRQPQRFICPGKDTRIPFFTLPCKSTENCSILGPHFVCCKQRCLKGVRPQNPEPKHAPLFGVIGRACPVDPIPELLAIQECVVDEDCGPRICCPERPISGGEPKSYCRNATPNFAKMPVIRQFLSPLKAFASYLQCTPPPPPFLDLFPKLCESVLDCFPSLCCQENGRKVCRPPKKSLFTLIAVTAQRVGTSSIAKNLIKRISK